MSGDREIRVAGRRVDDVSKEPIDGGCVLVHPSAIVLGDDSSRRQEIAVMEVMVVVEPVSKVDVNVGRAGLADDSTPVGLISGLIRRSRVEL